MLFLVHEDSTRSRRVSKNHNGSEFLLLDMWSCLKYLPIASNKRCLIGPYHRAFAAQPLQLAIVCLGVCLMPAQALCMLDPRRLQYPAIQ